ncbi:hypothetical protein [Persicobacter psychrovividus]|uniref:DUF5668 domain-containing protein n=1 Tax=Persicobacter psychrovividus TaxID=387638 RepID=A0ABN6LCI0_9BACT|nr:hypothetical protein PEPS_31980 [Persicobacter psychrovividus]
MARNIIEVIILIAFLVAFMAIAAQYLGVTYTAAFQYWWLLLLMVAGYFMIRRR